MSLDVFVFQIVLLFVPGVVWARLDVAWARRGKLTDLEFFVLSFLYGLCSYLILYLIYFNLGKNFELVKLQNKYLLNGAIIREVIYATIISLIGGIVWLYASNYKIVGRFLHLIRATNRFGVEDVWDYTFNNGGNNVGYAFIRDYEQQLVYAGDVKAFSESGEIREIALANAAVYDFDSNELYRMSVIYLARKQDNITIEFAPVPGPGTTPSLGTAAQPITLTGPVTASGPVTVIRPVTPR